MIRIAMPRKTRLVASVARNECTCSDVMIDSVDNAEDEPDQRRNDECRRSGSTFTAIQAAETVATPKIAPVERSKPPPMIDQRQRRGDDRKRRRLVQDVEEIARRQESVAAEGHVDHQRDDDEHDGVVTDERKHAARVEA